MTQSPQFTDFRYGWAIVSFYSQQGRNTFLEDENRHFVRESKDDSWEKLKVNHQTHIKGCSLLVDVLCKIKVSPWFDKRRAVGRVERRERSPVVARLEQRNPRPVPLYKADLTRDQGQYEWEDFCRSCTDNSTASYKGRIHSYLSSSSSLGLLEVGSYVCNCDIKIANQSITDVNSKCDPSGKTFATPRSPNGADFIPHGQRVARKSRNIETRNAGVL